MAYHVRGRFAATTANADHAIFQVWNGSSNSRIRLIQFYIGFTAGGTAGDSLRFRRSTVRGTAGSTITPDVDHHAERGAAPPSGFVLDLAAFTVQPTLDGSEIGPGIVLNDSTAGACGYRYKWPGGIVIPPGTGLVCAQRAATIRPSGDMNITVQEEW